MKKNTVLKKQKKHYLKDSSSRIVVILKSLRHGSCVNCGKPTPTYEAASDHWEKELNKEAGNEKKV